MKRLWLLLALAAGALSCIAQEQQFAEFGDFRLSSGETLRDCRIGYRTFGTLNADKSNAILWPTWAGGTTEQLVGTVKSYGLSSYYVVAVDALANGVSSSPSNSKAQPRMKFPKVTIRDMVETQHALLTRVLGIQHVVAVTGISMGGMQTFQWMVSYPDFMDKAIPIVGSPRLAPYDLLLWQSQIDAIERDPEWKGGDYDKNPARVAEAEFGGLLLTTPEHFNRTNTREGVAGMLQAAREKGGGSDANDKIRQTEAMMALDVSDRFGGSMDAAVKAVRAKTLVIVARQDHVVTPGPAADFGNKLGVDVIVLTSDCGHLSNGCESKTVTEAVKSFLAK